MDEKGKKERNAAENVEEVEEVQEDEDFNDFEEKPQKRNPIGMVIALLLVFTIGYAVGDYLNPNMFGAQPTDVVPVVQDELVFMVPTDCTDLCVELEETAKLAAIEANLKYSRKDINLQGIPVPGIMVMGEGFVTPSFPVVNASTLNEVMCNEYGYSALC